MVPSGSGIFPEYREVTGTSPGEVMGLLGLIGGEEKGHVRGAPPLAQTELD